MNIIKTGVLIIVCSITAFTALVLTNISKETAYKNASPHPVEVKLSVAGKTKDSIRVNIDLKESALTEIKGSAIQLQICDRKSKSNKNKNLSVDEKSYTFRGLRPYRNYSVKARFICNGPERDFYAPWSEPVNIWTNGLGKKQLLRIMTKASAAKTTRTFFTDYKIKKTKAGKELIAYTKKLKKRYSIRYIAIDLKSGEGFASGGNDTMYSASCLKGPYVASLCKYKPDSYAESFDLMYTTIVDSDNNTYKQLHRTYGPESMGRLMNYSQVSSFSYAERYTNISARDLGKLWVGMYWYFYKDRNKRSKACRKLYTHGYQSFICKAMKKRCKVHTKAGWFPGGMFNVQNDAGIIMAKVEGISRPYVLSVISNACGQHKKLQKLVRLIDNVHTDMV